MIETKQLSNFIKMHETKLQAKIYARKYERLASMFKPADDKLADDERRYDYQAEDGIWLRRGDDRTDDVLAEYELKFLR